MRKTPNPRFEPTARKRRLRVPSRLRRSAAAQTQRSGDAARRPNGPAAVAGPLDSRAPPSKRIDLLFFANERRIGSLPLARGCAACRYGRSRRWQALFLSSLHFIVVSEQVGHGLRYSLLHLLQREVAIR